MVTFTTKDRNKIRTAPIKITAVAFIWCFLIHSLPKVFVRIKHYGFLANRDRMANETISRRLMGLSASLWKNIVSLEEMMLQLTGIGITTCFLSRLDKF